MKHNCAGFTFGRNLPSFGRGSIYEAEQRLKQQLEGDGVLVALLKGTSVDGSRTDWEIFRAPQSLEGAVKANAPPSYRAVCVLTDESGGEIARVTDHVRGVHFIGPQLCEFEPLSKNPCRAEPLEEGWWIGPAWTYIGTTSTVLVMEVTISSISPDDLGRLSKTAVFLEEDTKGR